MGKQWIQNEFISFRHWFLDGAFDYGFILLGNLENNIKGKTLWKALTLP